MFLWNKRRTADIILKIAVYCVLFINSSLHTILGVVYEDMKVVDLLMLHMMILCLTVPELPTCCSLDKGGVEKARDWMTG